MDTIDTYRLLNSLGDTLPWIYATTMTLIAFSGFLLAANSAVTWVAESRRGESPEGNLIRGLIVGALMFSIPVIGMALNMTLTNIAPTEVNTWSLDQSLSPFEQVFLTLLTMLNIIGWITLARGVKMWYSGPKSKKEDWGSTSLVLILSGVIMINIFAWISALGNTLEIEAVPSEYIKHYKDLNNKSG
jgi:hypothetical protein